MQGYQSVPEKILLNNHALLLFSSYNRTVIWAADTDEFFVPRVRANCDLGFWAAVRSGVWERAPAAVRGMPREKAHGLGADLSCPHHFHHPFHRVFQASRICYAPQAAWRAAALCRGGPLG